MKGDKNCSAPDTSSVTYIFRPYITLRNGERLYAKSRGLKAFPIAVRAEKH